MRPRWFTRRSFLTGLAVSTIVNGSYFVWVGGSTTSWGCAPRGSELLFIVTLLALPGLLLGLVLLAPSATRASGRATVLCSLLLLVPAPLAWFGALHLRRAGLARFTARSQPLIDAIQAFERDRDAPPATLDALVPTYLDAVPGTGMSAYPEYKYAVGDGKSWRGNPWALSVPVPATIVSWDRLCYFPDPSTREYAAASWLGGGWVYESD